jgi:hypothetical protein
LGVSSVTPFTHPIEKVIARGSEEEVCWIDASPVVAGVADLHSVRDGAKMHLVASPVRVNVDLVDTQVTVTPAIEGAGPVPAIAGLVYLAPEESVRALLSVFGKARAAAKSAFAARDRKRTDFARRKMRHQKLTLSGVMAPDAQTSGVATKFGVTGTKSFLGSLKRVK